MSARVLLFSALLTASCGPPASSCPSAAPSSCQTPVPSWDGGISQIVQSKCVTCHYQGNTISGIPLATWTEVHDRQSDVTVFVNSCRMPFPDGGVQLTSDEKSALLDWLVCGAPNN